MKISKILLASLFCFAISAQAQDRESTADMDSTSNNLDKAGDSSIGIKWGDLTGPESKYWYNQTNAYALWVAFNEGNTAVGLDHLWHFRDVAADVTGLDGANSFVPYVGAGLFGAFGDNDPDFFDRETEDFGLALRAPLGIEILPRQVSLGIYAEVAPSFGVIPTAVTFITADVGARYYF